MITLDFLEAADGTPLTKTFRAQATGYDVEPYPLVRNFNSHRTAVNGPKEFHDALVKHAKRNHCLLKGTLRRRLKNESRQGMCDSMQSTSWICLDPDFYEGWDSVDEFLASLDPALANVSYIFQHSSSSGIKGPVGLRGHIFIQLQESLAPEVIKMWLRARNLSISALRSQLKLGASGAALIWPLDITTCQNDKLLYIAPPNCIGFDDPLEERFTLVQKDYDHVGQLDTLTDLQQPQVVSETEKALNELRSNAGLPKRKPKMREVRGMEYLTNPDEALVTSIKAARGFVYLNLNGGDSWGYFFPEDNPEFLHNFKGEPIVRLKDIAPNFYREYKRARIREAQSDRDFEPLVFHDRQRDCYWTVRYYPESDTADFARTNSQHKLKDFMLQYGESPPEIIEDWTVEFNPTTLTSVDKQAKWLNTFQPTEFIRRPSRRRAPKIPPTVEKIIYSANGFDPQMYNHFINWIAFIFQNRRKSGTAFVQHGVPGTGKGLLRSHILVPIFGAAHVLPFTSKRLEDQFNAALENALFIFIDEFDRAHSESSSGVMATLKHIITEETIGVRAMRQDTRFVPNYTNVIIATNTVDPVHLTPTDRRFNVAPAQEQPLRMTNSEVDGIIDQIPEFVAYLHQYEVDAEAVRTIIPNQARQSMIQASQTSVERFFDAIRYGNLEYFFEFAAIKMPHFDRLIYTAFAATVTQWAEDASAGRKSTVDLAQLRAAYHYVNGTSMPPSKMARMVAIYRLDYSDSVRGTVVRWNVSQEAIEEFFRKQNESHPSGDISEPTLRVIKGDQ